MTRQSESSLKMIVVFWGSLWGLAEATLGTLLHMVPWIAGFFMFPVGFYFMHRAYKGSGRLSSIFLTASVAATIKLTGLVLAIQAPVRVLNPAMSILIEGMAVLLFFKAFGARIGNIRFREILTVAAGWRILFIGYHMVLLALSLYDGILQLGWDGLAVFLVLESLVNTGIILAFLKMETLGASSYTGRIFRPSMLNSLLLFTAAVFCELLF